MNRIVPILSTEQLWRLNLSYRPPQSKTDKEKHDQDRKDGKEVDPVIHYDVCPLCRKTIPPVLFKPDGSPVRDAQGAPVLSNYITMLGNLCPICKQQGKTAFVLNGNLRNIKVASDDLITFQILIDGQWQEAELLPNDNIPLTKQNLYQPWTPAKDNEERKLMEFHESQRLPINISRQRLIALAQEG